MWSSPGSIWSELYPAPPESCPGRPLKAGASYDTARAPPLSAAGPYPETHEECTVNFSKGMQTRGTLYGSGALRMYLWLLYVVVNICVCIITIGGYRLVFLNLDQSHCNLGINLD